MISTHSSRSRRDRERQLLDRACREKCEHFILICCFITWKPASVRWWRPAHSRVTRSLQWLAREMRAWSVRATQLEMQRYLEQADITL